MSTIDNVVLLLKEQNKTQKDLCDYLGVTKNAFTDWKSGRTKSYNKHLSQIADYFGVSVDYLLGKSTNDTGCTSDLLLTDEETALISAYRKNPQFHEAIKKLLSF